jgi:hypothetical protein
MARVVVISTAEMERGTLDEHLESSDELIVVVPAVEVSRLAWLANDEGDARRRAGEVGEAVADEAPASASDVEVTPEVPRQAVLDAIAEHDPDRVVVALRDGEDATWLEEGQLGEMPGQIAGVPVVRVNL